MSIRTSEFNFPVESVDYAAKMTENQFVAIASKICKQDLISELNTISNYNTVRVSKKLFPSELKKWLYNSWNTEVTLRANQIIIEETNHPFVIHWAIPQVYYCVFSSILSLYKVLGIPETSHTAVRRKFSELVKYNWLPNSISFYAEGYDTRCKYYNISRPVYSNKQSSISFNPLDNQSVNKQVCQFLKSTRDYDVKELKSDRLLKQLGFVNKKTGKPKICLSASEWAVLDSKIHSTTLLDLLYRKRIKSNYSDIEVFTNENLNAKLTLKALIGIVDRLCLVNEAYIYKAIGEVEARQLIENFMKGGIERKKPIETRFNLIHLQK